MGGNPTVYLLSQTPASIIFTYKTAFVSLSEVTNAAQWHCEKYNKFCGEVTD